MNVTIIDNDNLKCYCNGQLPFLFFHCQDHYFYDLLTFYKYQVILNGTINKIYIPLNIYMHFVVENFIRELLIYIYEDLVRMLFKDSLFQSKKPSGRR